MKPHEGFVRFGIITICIAIPTYWFIILIQFHEPVNRWWDKIMHMLLYRVLGRMKPMAATKISRTRDRKRLGSIQKSATNTTLQRRLTSMSLTGSIGARQSVGQIDQELSELSIGQNGSINPGSPRPRRPSTIRWSEPFSPDGPRNAPVFAEPSPLTSDADVADQLRLPERALSMQDTARRVSTVPRRASLLRRFSSGSGGQPPTQSLV